MSPFEVAREHPLYSSSDGESVEEDIDEKDGTSCSLLSGASSAVNNLAECLEGASKQSEFIVEKVRDVSVVSFSRNDGVSIEEIIFELERLGVESSDWHERAKGSPSGGDTCQETCSNLESEPVSPDILGTPDSIFWITDIQVIWQQLIGQGSYGKVYRAVSDDQAYALKVVEASSKSHLRKLAAEARVNMLLKHENVVHCFKCCFLSKRRPEDAPNHDESPLELWMLQELCEGGTLDDAIRGPFYPPGNDRAARERILMTLSTQIAKGLEHIHSHGHIHGDLSSNNVLLALPQDHAPPGDPDAHGRTDRTTWESVTLKISDFGRSKEKGLSSCRTDSIGTVTFMPPEALTTGSLLPSSDIYSFGVILLQLWTGALPYQGCNFAQIIFQTSQGCTPQIPCDMDAPERMKSIIRKCLSPMPADRPTATEILGMLNGQGRLSVAEV